MARGGARKRRDEPERRCVATGESGPTEGLVRFVLDPDGVATPDLAERLPGRGVWVTARRDLIERAAKRGLFSRGFKTPARVPEGLAAAVEAGLTKRLIEALGLARKAGLVTTGFDQVDKRLRAGPVAALIEAADGSVRQRRKLRPLAGEAPVLDRLTGEELGLAFGRESVIHASLDAGGAADRVLRESRRLAGFRPAGPIGVEGVAEGDGETGQAPHPL